MKGKFSGAFATRALVAARAGRDVLCGLGAAALIGFYAAERSWLWLLPASAILPLAAWCAWKFECAREAIRRQALARLAGAQDRARRAMELPPPRPDQKRWLLTENEIPVAIETNERAAENWMGLGAAHDAVAFEPPAWRARKAALRRARRARDRREAQADAFDEEHSR